MFGARFARYFWSIVATNDEQRSMCNYVGADEDDSHLV